MSKPEHVAFKNFPADFRGDLLRPDDLGYAQDVLPTAPRELVGIAALTECPPLPPVPVEYHGADVAAVQPLFWSVVNSMLDVIAPPGRRVYTKGAYPSESELGDNFAEDSVAFSREGANGFWETVTQRDRPEDDKRFHTGLEQAKSTWDPHNLLRFNKNIAPVKAA